MAVAVGARSLFGMAEETSSYGTYVAPTRGIEFLAGESLARRENFYEPQGIGGGGARNFRAGAKRVSTHRDAGGTISFEVGTRNFGLFHKHLIGGTPAVAQPDSVGNPTVYTHTFTLGTVADRSLSLHKQLRDASDVVIDALGYPGAILTRGTWSITPGDPLLRLEVEVDARDEDNTVANTAISFVDASPYTYRQGALTVGGTAVANVAEANITLNNPMVVDRYRLGNSGLKARPVDSDVPNLTGTFVADFENSTYYDYVKNNSNVQLVITFTGALISGTYNEKWEMTVPEVRFSNAPPTIGSTGLISQTCEFGGWKNAAGAAGLTLVVTTKDSAV